MVGDRPEFLRHLEHVAEALRRAHLQQGPDLRNIDPTVILDRGRHCHVPNVGRPRKWRNAAIDAAKVRRAPDSSPGAAWYRYP